MSTILTSVSQNLTAALNSTNTTFLAPPTDGYFTPNPEFIRGELIEDGMEPTIAEYLVSKLQKSLDAQVPKDNTHIQQAGGGIQGFFKILQGFAADCIQKVLETQTIQILMRHSLPLDLPLSSQKILYHRRLNVWKNAQRMPS